MTEGGETIRGEADPQAHSVVLFFVATDGGKRSTDYADGHRFGERMRRGEPRKRRKKRKEKERRSDFRESRHPTCIRLFHALCSAFFRVFRGPLSSVF